MVRNVICALVLTVLVGSSPLSLAVFHPKLAHAQTTDDLCSLDGYLAASFPPIAEDQFLASGQTITIGFAITNDSSRFTYAGVDVGIALYNEESDTIPIFWSEVARDITLADNSSQSFESIIDGTYLPAGEYIARIGLSQSGQVAALAMATQGAAATIQKEAPGAPYQFELTANQIPLEVGDVAEFSVTATNDTTGMLRDYEQYLVLANSERPLGTAVVRSLGQPVKMMPGATEELSIEPIVQTEGDHSVIAFTARQDTFLPVLSQAFPVGDGPAPRAAHLVATGVDLYDQTKDMVEIVSCLGSVEGDSASVMQVEQVVQQGETVLVTDSAEVSHRGQVSSKIKKIANQEFVVTSNLYSTLLLATDEQSVGEDGALSGSLQQSYTQNFFCDDNCNQESFVSSLDTFAAEESVQTALWFYLGIIAASVLLMFLMIGRLTPPEENEHEAMHEPE